MQYPIIRTIGDILLDRIPSWLPIDIRIYPVIMHAIPAANII